MKVNDELIRQAEQWNDFKANKNTAKKNDPEKQRELTVLGNLAEIIFNRTKWRCKNLEFPRLIRISETDRQADFIVKDRRVDVKVKLGNEYLKPFYEVSIQHSQANSNTDWYAFYHYNRIEKDINFLGWISKDSFFKKAIFRPKGYVYKNNGHPVENDVWQLKISELE